MKESRNMCARVEERRGAGAGKRESVKGVRRMSVSDDVLTYQMLPEKELHAAELKH